MGEGQVCMAVLNGREVENDTDNLKCDHHWLVVDSSGAEPCAKKQARGEADGMETDACGAKQVFKTCSEYQLEDPSSEIKLELDAKQLAKETSNDDICSEVSNPNLSPRENALSFQTVTSQSFVELEKTNQGACGEITSTCSVSSSNEESSNEELCGTNDTSGNSSMTRVILEIPKHTSTTGVRKITFKFSKRKEDHGNHFHDSADQSVIGAFDDGLHTLPQQSPWTDDGTSNAVMMSEKAVPKGYPTNVKMLLSTRILEGAKVKYVSFNGNRQLLGVVKDWGYVCGCSLCNFTRTLSAHEFEQHAGGKTRHPNNHIYLENGKPIYSIIEEIRTAPLSIIAEVIKDVAGSSVNDEFLQIWTANLLQNIGKQAKYPSMYQTTRQNLSYSSLAVEKKQNSEGGPRKRDNDLHRLLFMTKGLPDGTELAYYARGQKVLGGYKQGSGIVCNHCESEVSPSQFEAHAGWAAKRQPYRHIYTSSGLTLHDIALLLASGQSIATTNSDGMCAVCGDRGELINCGNCPRAFHSVCLGLEHTPIEDWQCPHCSDNFVPGRKATGESRPIIIRLKRVVKVPESESGGCVVCRAGDFSVAKFDERTIMICDQCEKEYHVGCLRDRGLCDLKELPKDKWFCCDHCSRIHAAMQHLVSSEPEMVQGSVSSAIKKKHVENGWCVSTSSDIQWRILSGKSRYPEHLPLLSRAAAIFHECFDPIVAKSGRDLIPVMVYGRSILGQEFGGIYCIVLVVGSIVVSAGLLRIFGREVAELPLVATSRQYQGKGYFQALFSCIEQLLLSLNVETLVLPAAEDAESIWTNKLGFRKMSDERYLKYSRDLQLTVFKGTCMLEKELIHVSH